MKRFISFLIFILFVNIIYADQIHKLDRSVVNGKIIQITNNNVEFNPEGPKTFDFIPRDEVFKIVYDDGRVLQLAHDSIYLSDGKVKQGVVTKVDNKSIQYTPKGKQNSVIVPRNKIDSIQFSDGKMLSIESEGSEPAEPFTRVPGFQKSFIRVLGFGGGGIVKGTIEQRENRLFESNVPALITNLGLRDYDNGIFYYTYGADLDILLPTINFSQNRAFDFTGIQISLRGRYGHVASEGIIYDGKDYDGSEIFDGRLLTYNYWAVGPVFDLLLTPRGNSFAVSFNMYALYGQIIDGQLSAGAAIRDSSAITGLTSRTDYRTGVSGHTFRFGIGPHFILNRWIPITVGINYTFSTTKLNFDHSLSVYNDTMSQAYVYNHGVEVSLGFHL